MQQVDNEIRRIIDDQYTLARRLLDENRDKVEVMTAALLEWETIDAEQIEDIMQGRPPRPPRPAGNTGSGNTPPAPPAPATPTIKPAQEV